MQNFVVLEGKLEEKPKELATKNGKFIVSFRIKNTIKAAGIYERSFYATVFCFGRLTEPAKELTAGSHVVVHGALESKKNEKGYYETCVSARDLFTVDTSFAETQSAPSVEDPF